MDLRAVELRVGGRRRVEIVQQVLLGSADAPAILPGGARAAQARRAAGSRRQRPLGHAIRIGRAGAALGTMAVLNEAHASCAARIEVRDRPRRPATRRSGRSSGRSAKNDADGRGAHQRAVTGLPAAGLRATSPGRRRPRARPAASCDERGRGLIADVERVHGRQPRYRAATSSTSRRPRLIRLAARQHRHLRVVGDLARADAERARGRRSCGAGRARARAAALPRADVNSSVVPSASPTLRPSSTPRPRLGSTTAGAVITGVSAGRPIGMPTTWAVLHHGPKGCGPRYA